MASAREFGPAACMQNGGGALSPLRTGRLARAAMQLPLGVDLGFARALVKRAAFAARPLRRACLSRLLLPLLLSVARRPDCSSSAPLSRAGPRAVNAKSLDSAAEQCRADKARCSLDVRAGCLVGANQAYCAQPLAPAVSQRPLEVGA